MKKVRAVNFIILLKLLFHITIFTIILQYFTIFTARHSVMHQFKYTNNNLKKF